MISSIMYCQNYNALPNICQNFDTCSKFLLQAHKNEVFFTDIMINKNIELKKQ